MIAFQTVPRIPRIATSRQRSIRRRTRRYSLKRAVRFAVDVCFRFSGKALHSKALWSEKERVWLGSKTFLDWSMSIENIDIPWVVAQPPGAGRRRGTARGGACRTEFLLGQPPGGIALQGTAELAAAALNSAVSP